MHSEVYWVTAHTAEYFHYSSINFLRVLGGLKHSSFIKIKSRPKKNRLSITANIDPRFSLYRRELEVFGLSPSTCLC